MIYLKENMTQGGGETAIINFDYMVEIDNPHCPACLSKNVWVAQVMDINEFKRIHDDSMNEWWKYRYLQPIVNCRDCGETSLHPDYKIPLARAMMTLNIMTDPNGFDGWTQEASEALAEYYLQEQGGKKPSIVMPNLEDYKALDQQYTNYPADKLMVLKQEHFKRGEIESLDALNEITTLIFYDDPAGGTGIIVKLSY